MEWNIFFSNIIIHVGLMALFLTIFFFTIAQYFEKQIIEKQIDFVIDDFVGDTFKALPNDTKETIKTEIDSIFDKEDFNKLDNDVKKKNSEIRTKAWSFVGILVGVILFVIIIIGFIFKWNYYYINFLFKSSLYSLLFVAITETSFMFLIAQNYLSADPSKIKLNILETFFKNACNPCKKTPCIGSTIATCQSQSEYEN
jgi:hypothetical protein